MVIRGLGLRVEGGEIVRQELGEDGIYSIDEPDTLRWHVGGIWCLGFRDEGKQKLYTRTHATFDPSQTTLKHNRTHINE